MIDHTTGSVDAFDYPTGFAQGGDEEADALFQRDIDPFLHAPVVALAGLFDKHVHADGFVCECADKPQAGAKLVAVYVGERDRLHDADAACFGNGGDQFRIGTGVHGPADDRRFDAGVF